MRRKIRLLLWRYRHVLAVALFGTAALLVVQELRPPPPGNEVYVAARPLAAGQVIQAEHLTRVPLAVPAEGLLVEPLGQTLIVSIPAGLPIAESMVLGPGLTDRAPPGTVVAPVHVADPAIFQLLRVGDTVDLYSSEINLGAETLEARLITHGALVLALPGNDGGSTLGFLPSSTPEHTAFIAAIRQETANLFTGASGLAPFRVVIASTHE